METPVTPYAPSGDVNTLTRCSVTAPWTSSGYRDLVAGSGLRFGRAGRGGTACTTSNEELRAYRLTRT